MNERSPVFGLGLSQRQKSAAFVTVVIAVVLEVADSTIVNTALPAIRLGLGASDAAMQWIVAGYLLSLGSLLLLGGKLGEAYGYSRMFLMGVVAFIATSALCGLARDPTQLVLARMAQGVAGAIMAPQTLAIVQVLYSPLERVSKLAYFGVIVGLAAIIGPIVGGMLIELDLFGLGWRLVFLINLPIGLCAIVAGWLLLPETRTGAETGLDAVGGGICAILFGLILYAFIEGAERGWTTLPLVAGAIGLPGLTLAWHRAKRRRVDERASIIEPSLFIIPTFSWGIVAALFFSAAVLGFLLVFAVTLQEGLGLGPLDTALVHIPFGTGVMLGVGLIVPRQLPRMGKTLPILGGALMMTGVAAAMIAMYYGHSRDGLLLAVMAIAGIGMGLLSGPLGPVIMARVPAPNAGVASATFRTVQQLGGACGIAIVGAAYFSAGGATRSATLNGLLPAGIAVVSLLIAAVLAVARLPNQLFLEETPGRYDAGS